MKLILHIGYPKVMSKFLQTEIFCNLNSLNFLNHEGSSYLLYHKIREYIFYKTDEQFEENLSNLQKEISDNLSKEKLNIFSDEIYLWPNENGYEKIFFRLSKIFNFLKKSDINIIIFKREQSQILQSMYCENQKIFTILDSKFIDFNFLIKDIFIKKNLNKKKLNFFRCLEFNKVSDFLLKKYDFKVYLFNYDDIILKNQKIINEIAEVLNCNYSDLIKPFSKRPVHMTKKNDDIYILKNEKLLNFFRLFTFNKIFRSFFSLKFKFYIKNLLFQISNKKLNFDKKNLYYIKKFYEE
jgi:hypothetical protein